MAQRKIGDNFDIILQRLALRENVAPHEILHKAIILYEKATKHVEFDHRIGAVDKYGVMIKEFTGIRGNR